MNLFEGSYGGKIESAQACRPDPEEQLQRARKHKETCESAELLFLKLDEAMDYHWPEDERLFALRMLGRIRSEYHRAAKDEKYWLDEIDRSAK